MKIQCLKCKAPFRRSKLYPKTIVRTGTFYRKSDRKRVQRFFCKPCSNYFSVATLSDCYRQKKRQINSLVVKEMVSVVSLRECHRKLKINRKTVSRKLVFMAARAERKLEQLNKLRNKVSIVEFDDMETFEHTKCKPLSITIALTGQGELKKIGFDPLFSLNHTCAIMRAKVSRLTRRAWNTTKKPERLSQHLALAVLHHNLNFKTSQLCAI